MSPPPPVLCDQALGVKTADVSITGGFTSEEDKHISVKNKTGMTKDQITKRIEAAVS